MEYTLEEKYRLAKEYLLKETSINPLTIVRKLMDMDFINMHGPEHHFIDGASFLVAYNNVTNELDINKALDALANRSINMPGAICGNWGVCGSVTSLGAALSIIHEVGPLSNNDYYKDDMEFTSLVLNKMSKIGGPRCCKRNAFISLMSAVEFIKDKYNVELECSDIYCTYSSRNKQCIGIRCPLNK